MGAPASTAIEGESSSGAARYEVHVLDLNPELEQQAEILRRFSLPMVFSPHCGLKEFFLVVLVGRCKFRVDESLVSNLLQAVLGGNAHAFKVSFLNDRVYKFSVSSKKVGFFIYNLRFYECDSFRVSFHLWGNGGPSSQQEVARWKEEQDREWTMVRRKRNKQKVTSADVVKGNVAKRSILTGVKRVPIQQRSAATVPVSSAFTSILGDKG